MDLKIIHYTFMRNPLFLCYLIFLAGPSHQDINVQSIAYQGNGIEKLSGYVIMGKGVRLHSPEYRRFLQADAGYSPFGKGGLHSYDLCSNHPLCLDSIGHYDDRLKPNSLEEACIGKTIHTNESTNRKVQSIMTRKSVAEMAFGEDGKGKEFVSKKTKNQIITYHIDKYKRGVKQRGIARDDSDIAEVEEQNMNLEKKQKELAEQELENHNQAKSYGIPTYEDMEMVYWPGNEKNNYSSNAVGYALLVKSRYPASEFVDLKNQKDSYITKINQRIEPFLKKLSSYDRILVKQNILTKDYVVIDNPTLKPDAAEEATEGLLLGEAAAF